MLKDKIKKNLKKLKSTQINLTNYQIRSRDQDNVIKSKLK
jgi:hypothetical protein